MHDICTRCEMGVAFLFDPIQSEWGNYSSKLPSASQQLSGGESMFHLNPVFCVPYIMDALEYKLLTFGVFFFNGKIGFADTL